MSPLKEDVRSVRMCVLCVVCLMCPLCPFAWSDMVLGQTDRNGHSDEPHETDTSDTGVYAREGHRHNHHMGHTGERSRGDSRLRDWPGVNWRIVKDKDAEDPDNPDVDRYFSAHGRDVDVRESLLVVRLAIKRESVAVKDGPQRSKMHRIAYPCDVCGYPVTTQTERHLTCGPRGEK